MQRVNIQKINIENKINDALRALGLSFAEGFHLVHYNPKVKTAQWQYLVSTGDELIELGDMIVNLPVVQIEMVLRHEFLHRSIYHGFREQFDDAQTSNIALDICVNRLLYEAFPKEMKAMSVSVYPPESKSTIIALADCSANPAILAEPHRSLWKYIWEPNHDGSYKRLNPASIYFKLLELHDNCLFLLNPFSDFSQIDPRFSGNISERIVKIGSKIVQGISKKLPNGSGSGDGLNNFSVIPIKIGIHNIEKLLERLRINAIVTQFSSKIKRPLQKSLRLQPFPLMPSRIGYIYQIFGLTDILKMFWNLDFGSVGVRLAIGLYIDVSGSMVEHFSLISGFVDALKDYPVRIYAFDTKVREINIEEFRQGEIKGGGGTEFDCMISNFLNNRELAAAVIFTDGFGYLSDAIADNLLLSRKNIYLVWIRSDSFKDDTSVLMKYAKETLTIETKDSKYKLIK